MMRTFLLKYFPKYSYINLFNFFYLIAKWTVLIPQTKIKIPSHQNQFITKSANIIFDLRGNNEWIVALLDEQWLRMVKIQITGPNSYNWQRTIAVVTDDVEDSCLRSSTFTEQCLICHVSDLNQGCLSKARDEYEVLLYAKKGNFGI